MTELSGMLLAIKTFKLSTVTAAQVKSKYARCHQHSTGVQQCSRQARNPTAIPDQRSKKRMKRVKQTRSSPFSKDPELLHWL